MKILYYIISVLVTLSPAAISACTKTVDFSNHYVINKGEGNSQEEEQEIEKLADVKLPNIFGSNMVLQRNAKVAVWGTTDASAKVVVKGSWSADSVVVNANESGKWLTYLQTTAAGGPWEVTINNTVLSNVMTGEVWFCSGQSNMVMAMRGTVADGQPVEGSAPYINGADPSIPVRMFTIGTKASLSPLTTCSGVWNENNPESVNLTSAAAYFFALKLQETLNVPVGIIISAWGNTPIEAFIDKGTISSQFPGEFSLDFLNGSSLPSNANQYPCTLFNGQINPLIPFTFKGILWYQGENNRDRPDQYVRLQTSFAEMMRAKFDNPNAPFYFVQIAPYTYSNPTAEVVGFFNEAQSKTLETIKNSGMVTTVDIGSYSSIHPGKKKEVGDRLAYYALYNDYGVKTVNPVGPTFKSVEFKDGSAIIKMNVDSKGLWISGAPVTGFRIAGEDKVFRDAYAAVGFDTITVSSTSVPNPVAVRYCFTNWSTCSIFNSDGIPAGPFRTDKW